MVVQSLHLSYTAPLHPSIAGPSLPVHLEYQESNMPSFHGQFPLSRPRRNRFAAWTRRLVRENSLTSADLIWPVFVQEGSNTATDIPSMPAVQRLTIDLLEAAICRAADLGIPAIAVFPEPDSPVIQKRIPLFLLRISCFLIFYFWSRDNISFFHTNNLTSILF